MWIDLIKFIKPEGCVFGPPLDAGMCNAISTKYMLVVLGKEPIYDIESLCFTPDGCLVADQLKVNAIHLKYRVQITKGVASALVGDPAKN